MPAVFDVFAPDGSEISLLAKCSRGSMVYCSLPPGACSKAMVHRSVEELWFCLSGEGQFWRKQGDDQQVIRLESGVSLSIPTGVSFQFRCSGPAPLCFVIVTMPPWPGEGEALAQPGFWETGETT